MKCKTDADVEIVGQEWLLQQSRELKKAGAPVLALLYVGQTSCGCKCGKGNCLIITKILTYHKKKRLSVINTNSLLYFYSKNLFIFR